MFERLKLESSRKGYTSSCKHREEDKWTKGKEKQSPREQYPSSPPGLTEIDNGDATITQCDFYSETGPELNMGVNLLRFNEVF